MGDDGPKYMRWDRTVVVVAGRKALLTQQVVCATPVRCCRNLTMPYSVTK